MEQSTESKPPVWIDKYLPSWLPPGMAQDIREVSNAPRAIVVILILGGVGGWWAAAKFYAERFATMEARLAQAQEEAAAAKREQAKLTEQVTQAQDAGDAIVSWGGGLPANCGLTLDRAALASYVDKFDVAVACGHAFANVDKFADSGITLSPKYSLAEQSRLQLSIPSSAAMRSALQKHLQTEAQKFPPELRPKLVTNLVVWYDVLLVPKEILMSDIRVLSDLRRLGGQVPERHGRSVIVENVQVVK